MTAFSAESGYSFAPIRQYDETHVFFGVKQAPTQVQRRKVTSEESSEFSESDDDDRVSLKVYHHDQAKIHEDLKYLKLHVVELRDKFEQHRIHYERLSTDAFGALREELQRELVSRDELIAAAQEDMQLSRKKLAKETSDFQVKFKELKASIQEIF